MDDPATRGVWRIPAGAAPYRETREFEAETTPAALMRAHDTKAGVWGELVIAAGRLSFFDLRPGGACHELGPGRHGLIEPQAPHRVEPHAGVRFKVVFHRRS